MGMKGRRKSARKSANKTGQRVAGKNGNTIIAGNPGNSGGKKGRSGRKPSEFLAACRQAVDDHDLLGILTQIATNKRAKPGDRIKAATAVIEYGYGTAPATVRIEGEVDHHHHVEQVRSELKNRLAGIAGRNGSKGNGR